MTLSVLSAEPCRGPAGAAQIPDFEEPAGADRHFKLGSTLWIIHLPAEGQEERRHPSPICGSAEQERLTSHGLKPGKRLA